MTSARTSTLARCPFCGREFDDRRFQVLVEGMRGPFHSADCALRAATGETPLARERQDGPAEPGQSAVR